MLAGCKLKEKNSYRYFSIEEEVDFFVLQLGSGYGIYAGFQGAKTLINLKDTYRELDQEGEKLPIDYKYYKGLSLSLQSWSDSSNISEVKGVIIKYPVFFSELLVNNHMGPYHFFGTQEIILSLIRLTIVSFEISSSF